MNQAYQEPSRLFKKIGWLMQESMDYIGDAGRHHREAVRVLAVPHMSDGNRRAEYVAGVRGELVPVELEYRLSSILFQARASLDQAMFAAAHEDPTITYTEGEDAAISFPLTDTPEGWAKVSVRKYVAALGPVKVEALRSIQPFVTGSPIPKLLNDLHRFDKHRVPLELVTIADPQWVVVFPNVQDAPHGPGEWWTDWEQPNPAIAPAVKLFERRTTNPMVSAGPEDVKLALVARVGGDFIDVQDLLWDAMEYVTRAAEVLEGFHPDLADGMADYLAAERRQLAAFQRGMIDDDWTEWLEMSEKRAGASFYRGRDKGGELVGE